MPHKNIEKRKTYIKEWKQENKERWNKYKRENWHKNKEKNKEKYKEHNKQYYQRNKEKILKKSKEAYQRRMKWLRDIKTEKGCQVCEENHPAILVFHHRKPNEKEYEMCVIKNHSKEKILKEIEKCDVLCRNCHAKLHWEMKYEKNNSI